MKTIYGIGHLLVLLSGLTGLFNIAPVRTHSLPNNGDIATASRHDVAKVKESYSKIPLSFAANHGQAEKNVKFTSRGSGYSLALTPTTFTVAAIHSRTSASVIQATLLGGNESANLT